MWKICSEESRFFRGWRLLLSNGWLPAASPEKSGIHFGRPSCHAFVGRDEQNAWVGKKT